MGATPDDRPERRAGRDVLARRCARDSSRSRTRCTLRASRCGRPTATRSAASQVDRRAGLEHLQRRHAEAARVHLGARTARRQAPGARDGAGRGRSPSQLPTRDNPATSPYPIWRATKAYRLGDEVVWHQRVYEAKWYTQGYVPDTPVAHLWDTPWRYIGPVLKSDAQAATTAPRPSCARGRPTRSTSPATRCSTTAWSTRRSGGRSPTRRRAIRPAQRRPVEVLGEETSAAERATTVPATTPATSTTRHDTTTPAGRSPGRPSPPSDTRAAGVTAPAALDATPRSGARRSSSRRRPSAARSRARRRSPRRRGRTRA